MAEVRVRVSREGSAAFADVDFISLSVTDDIDRRGDGVDLRLSGDWSSADWVDYRLTDDSSPPAVVSSRARVLTASVTQDADAPPETRLKAGRLLGAGGVYYTSQIRALLTDVNIGALSTRHAAWTARFAAGESLSAAILETLDDDKTAFDDYVSTLADYRIGVRIDPILPAAGEAGGVVGLFARDEARAGGDLSIDIEGWASFARSWDNYSNPLGAWNTAPVSYLVGGAPAPTEEGSGAGERADLGEFALLATAQARRDAYRLARNGAALTGRLVMPNYYARYRPQTGVQLAGLTHSGVARWLIDSSRVDADAKGGIKTTLEMRAIQTEAATT